MMKNLVKGNDTFMSKLVIVESPAKAKTIKKYLGSDYEVVASMGHVRDLPAKRLSVNIRQHFKPQYEIIEGKEKLADELRKKAQKCDKVYLAADPDREGEAISWHLAYVLGLELCKKDRVTFNEITKSGVTEGMKHPRQIDINLVNAQQARRILDRLVGYKLSPFLSGKIKKGLSAGRVQSVALRIVVDREDEIRKFKPEEYWSLDAKFTAKGSRKIFAGFFHGDKNGKIKLESKEQVDKILEDLKDAEYKILSVKKGVRRKSPLPPFTTSTLQQDASVKLGFQPKRTMKVAQELYEGVNVEGIGAVGLITYMRTDSLRVSVDAMNMAAEYIQGKWGKDYLPDKPRVFKSKSNAQDAHEAIRPTMPDLEPDKVKSSLSNDQFKLYRLIWSRFIASQMANCLQKTTRADIDAAGKYIFKASGYVVSFDGYTVLYEDTTQKEKESQLPDLEKDMILKMKELIPNQHFTQPPARFTEASLIKEMESNGIGRPSTYATIITTILSRGYVEKEQKSLVPTELGEIVVKLLKDYFKKIVDLKFTAQMESKLDTVEDGKCQWVELLEDFYGEFYDTLKKAKEKTKDMKFNLPEEETDIICEKCGRKMVIKMSRFGKFIACPGFPECRNIKSIVQETGTECPKCGANVIVKKSKRGRAFYGCSNYPNCDFMSWDEPIKDRCPKCGKNLFKKKGKNGKVYCGTETCDYVPSEK